MTREPRATQKEAAWEVMEQAYLTASANGTLPGKISFAELRRLKQKELEQFYEAKRTTVARGPHRGAAAAFVAGLLRQSSDIIATNDK
jgi:hypothetical protein